MGGHSTVLQLLLTPTPTKCTETHRRNNHRTRTMSCGSSLGRSRTIDPSWECIHFSSSPTCLISTTINQLKVNPLAGPE